MYISRACFDRLFVRPDEVLQLGETICTQGGSTQLLWLSHLLSVFEAQLRSVFEAQGRPDLEAQLFAIIRTLRYPVVTTAVVAVRRSFAAAVFVSQETCVGPRAGAFVGTVGTLGAIVEKGT